ncbi:uncharacterized protein LOC119794788 isoform X1 [Cyprinodon tularosa]|uniref:uncharacterized protein LOC119794788 isoform X1 n=1 Tax=Cyprinodon tularosa TaxID=77115 RepID=UPI0018E28035|nr:uncharacterized protein LOC119794788 isoform X1 [Cyprinodon tularosa]
MAEMVYAVTRMLLLYFIRSGVNGKDDRMFLRRTFDTFPCDNICYDIWHFNTRGRNYYFAVVHNAEIQTSNPEDDGSKCFLHFKVDDGHLRCQKNPAASDLILAPGEKLSLQCVLPTHLRHKHCNNQQSYISLMWVDESSSKVIPDSQLQIQQRSPCDVTLTIALQSPASRRFKCQMAVNEQIQTSDEFWIRVQGPTGRGGGKGLILQPKADLQGHSMGTIGAAVGALGCMVVTALVAAFVVKIKKTRRDNQIANNSCNLNTGDSAPGEVIYAVITLPTGSDSMLLQECESTEYACIKYQ